MVDLPVMKKSQFHLQFLRMHQFGVRKWIYLIKSLFKKTLPGGVPQHILRSSMCSTSRPINHEPRDTSSLAYLCNMGLHSQYTPRALTMSQKKEDYLMWKTSPYQAFLRVRYTIHLKISQFQL